MPNLRKREIGDAVGTQTGIPQRTVYLIIQLTLDQITEALACGRRVELRNFGVFEIRVGKPRFGRNPKRPSAAFVISPGPKVKFTIGKVMLERVRELSNAQGVLKPANRNRGA